MPLSMSSGGQVFRRRQWAILSGLTQLIVIWLFTILYEEPSNHKPLMIIRMENGNERYHFLPKISMIPTFSLIISMCDAL